jgi:hypothetical protein
MCMCTPSIRTPYCGQPGCKWPALVTGRLPSFACLEKGVAGLVPDIKVAEITLDGVTCVVPIAELADTIGDDERNTYAVRIKTMSQLDFDAIPEFGGW